MKTAKIKTAGMLTIALAAGFGATAYAQTQPTARASTRTTKIAQQNSVAIHPSILLQEALYQEQ